MSVSLVEIESDMNSLLESYGLIVKDMADLGVPKLVRASYLRVNGYEVGKKFYLCLFRDFNGIVDKDGKSSLASLKEKSAYVQIVPVEIVNVLNGTKNEILAVRYRGKVALVGVTNPYILSIETVDWCLFGDCGCAVDFALEQKGYVDLVTDSAHWFLYGSEERYAAEKYKTGEQLITMLAHQRKMDVQTEVMPLRERIWDKHLDYVGLNLGE